MTFEHGGAPSWQSFSKKIIAIKRLLNRIWLLPLVAGGVDLNLCQALS